MKYQDFIEMVMREAGLKEDEAIAIVEATLETLGERISQHREDLATQLPRELKDSIFKRRETDRYSLEEFYDRITARAKITRPHAVLRTRTVMRVLQQAVSPGELRDILSELPAEYGELFGKEAESPLSPSYLTAKEQKRLESTKSG